MTGFGVPKSQAAAFALISHAIVFGSTTLWGGYLLLAANVPLRLDAQSNSVPETHTS
jgi:uncharacterized membrane protein YbhN (UPF0104 family)